MTPKPPKTTNRLVSLTVACPFIAPEHFLRAALGETRFYWHQDDITYAGFGTSTELKAWNNRFTAIANQARQLFADAVIVGENAAPRLFGGFAFSDDFMPDNTWAIYAPAYFVLPHYQLTQQGENTWLTMNILIGADENPQEVLPDLQAALEARIDYLQAAQISTESRPPILLNQNYPMPFETWSQEIQNATAQMQRGELQKVVLARVCELQFAESLDVDSALAYLNEKYRECYRFLFEPRPHHVFYGATPELLADVRGSTVKTIGLAGSIRRGKSPEEDAALADQIFHDPKERHEHALVVDNLRERLSPVTNQLNIPHEPDIFRLSNIQHLRTPIEGTLKNPAGILPLVELLHPTPALGGSPRELALDLIKRAEPVPRGWYAAPIGWLDHKLDGMFGVAIRSAVGQDRRVWLYAGAGIVASSIPQKEWDETALKFKPMLNALGIGETVNVRA